MSTSRNTLFNIGGAVASIVISLVTVPLYIHRIGDARYGVLTLVWLFLGYFGVFDMGLSKATAQAIAANFSAGPKRRSDIVWAALSANLVFGAAGGLVLWLAGHWLMEHALSVNTQMRGELLGVLPWIAVAVPVATTSSIFSGTLQGLSRFFEYNVLSVVGAALFQILPLCAAYLLGPDLRWLIPAAVVARLLALIPMIVVCVYRAALRAPRANVLGELPDLLRYGAWTAGNSIISPVFDGMDRVLIGALAGAQAVAYYAVPMGLVSRLGIVPASISQALFPRYAMAEDEAEARRHAEEVFFTVGILLAPIAVLGTAILPAFLTLWIGRDFSQHSALAAQILLFGAWFNCITQIPFVRLQAIGRPDLLLKLYIVQLVPYLCVLWAGLTFLGVAGAALAWSLRTGGDMVLLSLAAKFEYRVIHKLLPGTILLTASIGLGQIAAAPDIVIYCGQLILFLLSLGISYRQTPLSIKEAIHAKLSAIRRGNSSLPGNAL